MEQYESAPDYQADVVSGFQPTAQDSATNNLGGDAHSQVLASQQNNSGLSGLGSIVQGVKNAFQKGAKSVEDDAGKVEGDVESEVGNLEQGAKSGLEGAENTVKSGVEGAENAVGNAVNEAKPALEDVGNFVSQVQNNPVVQDAEQLWEETPK